MAKIEKIIPHLLKWETGVVRRVGEPLENLFERARLKGWAKLKDDNGGATMCGVTIGAYKTYCKNKGYSTPTEKDLHDIDFDTWLDILKGMFWDVWKADQINSQGVAEMCVDWGWGSGAKTAIKKVQKVVGTFADGIVGKKTLTAINGKAPLTLFYELKAARKAHYEAIVRKNPTQKKWLKGWLNRLNDLAYSE